MTPFEFFSALQAYCGRTGASVTSYYRTPLHNASPEVKGHPNSLHMLWLAADVTYDQPIPRAERELAARRVGIKILIEADHDHLSGAF